MGVGVDGDVGHVRLVPEHHQAGVADDLPARLGHDVEAGRALHDLGEEQGHRPWPRVDPALDVQHLGDVAAAHRDKLDPERVPRVVDRAPRRVDGRHHAAPPLASRRSTFGSMSGRREVQRGDLQRAGELLTEHPREGQLDQAAADGEVA